MAGNECILILRGTRTKLVENSGKTLKYGLLLYNDTDNYLTVGSSGDSKKLTEKPITVPTLQGYFNYTDGGGNITIATNSTTDTVDYYIKPVVSANSDKILKIYSEELINLDGEVSTSKDLTVDGTLKTYATKCRYYSKDVSEEGWYRIYSSSTYSESGRNTCYFTLGHLFNNTKNEDYAFSVSVGYMGDISITQISGCVGGHLIDMIRVVYYNAAQQLFYIDFHSKTKKKDTYYVYGVGSGTFQAPEKTDSTVASGWKTVEFNTVAGCKSDGGFTGVLDGTLKTARTIELTNGVSGKVSFDGGADVTIETTVNADYVNAGTLAIDYGGTGQTTAKGVQYVIGSDSAIEDTSATDITDEGLLVFRRGTPTEDTGAFTRKKASTLYSYVKYKISTDTELKLGNYVKINSSGIHLFSDKTNTTNTFKVDTSGNVTANSYNATSDKRLKTNIKEYKSEKSILNLPVYEFDYINGGKHTIGCMAQDLQEICPQIVNENEDGYLSILESKIIYLLLEEVKLLRDKVSKLEEEQQG